MANKISNVHKIETEFLCADATMATRRNSTRVEGEFPVGARHREGALRDELPQQFDISRSSMNKIFLGKTASNAKGRGAKLKKKVLQR